MQKTYERELPEGDNAEIGHDLFFGHHVKINGEIIKCNSSSEAQFVRYAFLNGLTAVQVPKNNNDLADAVSEYDNLITEILNKSKKILNQEVKDKKLRGKIEKAIERKIFKI